MSTTTTVRPIFTFEVELEMLVKPKVGTRLYTKLRALNFDPALQPGPGVDDDKKEKNRKAIREALAETLTLAGIATNINGSDYEMWDVKKGPSLSEVVDARGGGYWAIKLVSGILSTDNPHWAQEIHDVFAVVLGSFDILLTEGCSTHVHVEPNPEWTMSSIHGLMKATGVFDDAIMKIMPAERKMNPWARSSFRDGPLPTDKAQPELRKLFEEVPTKTWKPLFAVFERIKTINAVLLTWGQERNVSWNFGCLTTCKTAEFRRPPGVKTAADAQKWAAFTVAFVCAATKTDWQTPWLSSKNNATVAELQSFVAHGLRLLGWENFLDPSKLTENTSPAMPLE
ncbi:hypothetical protein B0I37DRAFT_45119 [Chaetomium sp. MPI-CAGE-AT-0009]|nr:hypothetical protein B0I37DRAFT_45119 [Chaetomium sp. MPI-CAGE-AT-0009]